jgi:tRNA(Ile)-lysidine synthase
VFKNLEVNIHKNVLFNKADKLLVAFSGGVDSVVLTDLLKSGGYHIELAHCNFMIRGSEANKDTVFCEMYAKEIGVPIHVNYFDTKTYAADHHLSIQMAARELRYNWFKTLKAQNGFDYILTAHHASDNVETLLVNLVRGTGVKGMQGIPEKQNFIVRPLLSATKEEILNYARKKSLSYRDDSSNQEVKYKRNFIRHKIIPELKKLNPALEETIHNSVQFFKQASEIVGEFAQMKFGTICHMENNQLFINIQQLLQEKQKETLLFEWLYPRQFKSVQILQLCEALLAENHTGKQFSSATHDLVIDRSHIIIQQKQVPSETEYVILSKNDTGHLPISLAFEETNDPAFSNDLKTITIPSTMLLFPLTLRRWRKGDRFKPFGMQGFKKLSDFFKDQKMSRFDKENVWVLENKEHILWIVGYRMDERCRVADASASVVKISIK